MPCVIERERQRVRVRAECFRIRPPANASYVCVCVCVCVRARARACVRVCARTGSLTPMHTRTQAHTAVAHKHTIIPTA